MATTARKLTYHDLEAIPEERPGDRHELIDGELIVTPSPVLAHQVASANVVRVLDRHVVDRDLGIVLYAPLDIRFTPDIVLIPDIVFIAQDRLHIVGEKTIDAAPDLVIEILSPGTRQRDLREKRALYARFGVQEFWLVDLEARSVLVLALAGDRFVPVPQGEGRVILSRVLPGLALTVDQVFANVR